jgi:glutamate--cysteine ligase
VEWSSRPYGGLDDLERQFRGHVDALDRAGNAAGVNWLEVAVDPVHQVRDMPWMPKARYGIMKPYMGARGRLSHRMMTQTASIQCAFDFRDEKDWTRKFRAAALTAPVSVALFANSSQVDGTDSGYRSYRQAIWKETDPERTGLPAVVFEPGFCLEKWIDFICNVPSIFHRRGRGLVPAGGIPFRSMMERTSCEAPRMEDWELHLSSVFTDVRSYAYIEVRSADLLPDDSAFAVPSFWTGLLYNENNLSSALEIGACVDDHAAWRQAMDSAAEKGLDGEIGGKSIRKQAVRLLKMIGSAYRQGTVRCGGDTALAALAALERRHRIEGIV